MLRAAHIHKSYDGRTVLQDISLTVRSGEIVCLLGPSGCGKTTLLRLLTGLDRPDTGCVSREGGQVGYLFQERGLLPWRTVAGNVCLGMEFQGAPDVMAARAGDCLAQLGLGDAGELYPHQISGGMKRRVALAQTLATQPDLLFLDEPMTGLDVRARRLISAVIKDYTRHQGAAAVIVTHSIEEAVFLADRILIFQEAPGRIAAEVKLDDDNRHHAFAPVLEKFSEVNPEKPYVASL